MSFAPVYAHDPVEEIGSDLFMVRGSVPLNAILTLSRNMAVIRQDGELTLVNSVRVSDAEEARLTALGKIRRIVRLGPFHGMDDAYYVDRFGAELWTPGPSSAYATPVADHTFTESTPPPIADAKVFSFAGIKQPEGCLLLERDGGTLLTCDGIQHYGDYRHNNLPARLIMPFIGFPKTTIIGPFWLKLLTPEGGSLESEFRRLLAWARFDKLLSAHGSFLASGAHAAVAAAVDKAFKAKK